jgi:hypothetical protein
VAVHDDNDLIVQAHRRSIRHRDELARSTLCGCFYCLKTFPFIIIHQWTDNDATAICPRCGMDSVIGDASASGFSIGDAFLGAMRPTDLSA